MSEEENKIRNILAQTLKTVLSNNDIVNYSNLTTFIDESLAEAYKLSGDDRAGFLVKTLLNIRSFLNSELITESSRKLIIANANNVIDEMYKEPEPEPESQANQLEKEEKK